MFSPVFVGEAVVWVHDAVYYYEGNNYECYYIDRPACFALPPIQFLIAFNTGIILARVVYLLLLVERFANVAVVLTELLATTFEHFLAADIMLTVAGVVCWDGAVGLITSCAEFRGKEGDIFGDF